MKEETWEIIGEFKYNSETYVAVMNDKCRKFYFKKIDDDYEYLSVEEYIRISKKFNTIKLINGRKDNTLTKAPLIKFKNKLVSSIILSSMILTLSGCGTPKNPSDTMDIMASDGIALECLSEDNSIYSIEGVNLENNKDLSSCGVSFEGYQDVTYKQTITPSQLANVLGYQTIEWEDLVSTVNNNQNIEQSLKDILIEGINNLKENNFDIDLSVLYYNLTNLTVEYVDPSLTNDNAGYFNHDTCTVVISEEIKINKDFYKEVMTHEILGHGSTRAYISEKEVLVDIMTPYLVIEDNGVVNSAGNYGYFGMEGIADIITSTAMNKKLGYDTAAYTPEVYYLSTLCASVGITPEEYANNGIEYLSNKMVDNGISNPYYYLTILDVQTELLNNYQDVQANSTELFIEYFQELISSGNTKYIEDAKTEYAKYITTENLEGNDIVVRMKTETSFAIVQPDEINNAIDLNMQMNK